jgi:hypothetical protein
MRLIVAAIGMLSLIMFPLLSVADTIVLKSGRKIDATKCWEDGDLVKCKVYGQVIGYHKGDIAEIKMDAAPVMPAKGFRYDIWQSGISVQKAIDIAEANDLPLHRAGLISANKKFNPKMCRPYADTAIRFGYKEQLFGKIASISFDFTPVSKKLYSLEIKWLGSGVSKQSEFRQQVESILRKRYGKPFRISDHIVFKDYDWKINSNATVTLRPLGNAVLVTYRDTVLANLSEKEKLGQVRSGFTINDKSKF